MEPFLRFKELFTDNKIKVSKKYEAALEKEAIKWFTGNFTAKFGTRSHDNNEYGWAYTCGCLSFSVKGLGEGSNGSYYYKFILRMIHCQLWNQKEWREGLKYGRYCKDSKMKLTNNNYRDANPYPEVNFYSNEAWDAGYVMGLSNFRFKLK